MSEGDRLEEVAAAIADGTPVDWQAESRAHPPLREALEHLSVLEKIRDLHRAPATASAETVSLSDFRHETGPALSRWGHLQVLEPVGRGGAASVYRAFDPTLQLQVALKLLPPSGSDPDAAGERIVSEARRLARVHHPNVMVVHGADRRDGRYGIWMELIAGQTLEERLREQGPISAREAALIGIDLCRALCAVHAAGIVHRDVKTSNVMREDGGRIVLMDFGSGADVAVQGDRTWHVHGTPMAMAPEQLEGRVAGPATDVYGLGTLLYRLVTGRYPIESRDFAEFVRKCDARERIPLLDRRADLPSEFVRVVERALAFDPAERYASAGALEAALAGTLGVLAPAAGRVDRRPERWLWLRTRLRHRPTAVVASVVVVLLGTAAALHPWDRPTPVPSPPTPHRPVAPSGSAPPIVRRLPLTADATLLRRTSSGEEALGAGHRIRPGDKLFLRIRGTDTMNVYVLNEDARGDVHVLYPIHGLSPENPLAPGVSYRLPGRERGKVLDWNVTSPGRRETVVAVAARHPLAGLEREIATFPRARAGHPISYGKLNPAAWKDLRGIGGLTPDPRESSEARSLSQAIEGLQQERANNGDLWVWEVHLENP